MHLESSTELAFVPLSQGRMGKVPLSDRPALRASWVWVGNRPTRASVKTPTEPHVTYSKCHPLSSGMDFDEKRIESALRKSRVKSLKSPVKQLPVVSRTYRNRPRRVRINSACDPTLAVGAQAKEEAVRRAIAELEHLPPNSSYRKHRRGMKARPLPVFMQDYIYIRSIQTRGEMVTVGIPRSPTRLQVGLRSQGSRITDECLTDRRARGRAHGPPGSTQPPLLIPMVPLRGIRGLRVLGTLRALASTAAPLGMAAVSALVMPVQAFAATRARGAAGGPGGGGNGGTPPSAGSPFRSECPAGSADLVAFPCSWLASRRTHTPPTTGLLRFLMGSTVTLGKVAGGMYLGICLLMYVAQRKLLVGAWGHGGLACAPRLRARSVPRPGLVPTREER